MSFLPALAIVFPAAGVTCFDVVLLVIGLPFLHPLVVDLFVLTLAFDVHHQEGMPVAIASCMSIIHDMLEVFGGRNLIVTDGHARVIFECPCAFLIILLLYSFRGWSCPS